MTTQRLDERLASVIEARDRDSAAAGMNISQQRASELVVRAILDGSLPLEKFMERTKRAALARAWWRHGFDFLAPVKREVGDEFSWIDIRVSRELLIAGHNFISATPVRSADEEVTADSVGGSRPPQDGSSSLTAATPSVEIPDGAMVHLARDPARHGSVRRSMVADGRRSYLVFFSTEEQAWFDADDIVPDPERRELRIIGREAFLRSLALTKLTSRFSDIFYAYRASRTNFEVYQFKPVLKFIGMDTPGLLIADEVGLGKTIEAAIIYLEMKARADVKRVLVVCPAGLKEKWKSELFLRFDEDFAVLDRQRLEAYVAQYTATEGHLPLKAIVSLESIRDDRIRELLTEAGVHLDLLIIDEAHHLRNRSTKSHQVAESLANLADRLLLLTATPLQTREEDLFNLLQLIAPGDFTDYAQFEQQLRPNAYLNRAIQALGRTPEPDVAAAIQLLEALPGVPYANAIVRNPAYTQSVERLGIGRALTPAEIIAMRRDLQLLNTIGHVYTRTKKRDVVGVAKREAHTVEVTLTDAEAAYYQAVIAWVRASSRSASNWGVLGFNLINRERQAASCIPASMQYFDQLLRTRLSILEMDSTEPALDLQNGNLQESASVVEAARALMTASNAVQGIDSKYDRLREALDGVLATDPSAKVIVFSFFKRTLRYLNERLARDGHRPLLITGDDKPESRARIVEEFRISADRPVLLSSEVGAEGLDFQFAYTIFNYDLPWNPMRVEQRIGRIDRYGQKAPKILIFNFVLQNTIESRILTRLYDRIRVFEEAVGDLEPILGDVLNFLTRSLFEKTLTEAEERALTRQVELQITEKEATLKDFESRRSELMGEDRLFEETVVDRVTSGRYVSPDELRVLIGPWLAREFPRTRLQDNEDRTWHISGDPSLGAHLQQGKFGVGGHDPEGRNFLQRMLAGRIVPLTFDPDIASGRPRVELIHPRHPLTLAAVEYWRTALLASTTDDIASLRLETDDVAPGTYDYFLFKLDISAASPSLTFEPVVFDRDRDRPDVAAVLLRLLNDADNAADSSVEPDEFGQQRSRAETAALRIRSAREAEAVSRNEALISLRREAIARAEDAKIARAREILATVRDARIATMKTREIENIEASKRARLAALDEKRRVIVSTQEVAAGRLEVVPVAAPQARDSGSQPLPAAPAQPAPRVPIAVVDDDAPAAVEPADRVLAPGDVAPRSDPGDFTTPPAAEESTPSVSVIRRLRRLLGG